MGTGESGGCALLWMKGRVGFAFISSMTPTAESLALNCSALKGGGFWRCMGPRHRHPVLKLTYYKPCPDFMSTFHLLWPPNPFLPHQFADFVQQYLCMIGCTSPLAYLFVHQPLFPQSL